MIGFDQALQLILQNARTLDEETVDLSFALGRVSARAVVADADAVPYARSAMDGYAVRAEDSANATQRQPIRLPVRGEVWAEQGQSVLIAGSSLAITTGAPLPGGADAVIPFEEIERLGDAIQISKPVTPGSSVFPPAEDIRCGDVLLQAGEIVRPGMLSLLAFAGRVQISVIKRPRISILSTGNELVAPDTTPRHGQIRNSNAIGLSALITELGGEPHDHGVAPDVPGPLGEMLDAARTQSNILVTCGGASQGERDLVKNTLEKRGAQFLFKDVAIRPGKPFGFALWDGLPVCVLPGNPSAAFVCFQQLVRPLLAKIAGNRLTTLPRVRAKLIARLHSRPARRYFVLSNLEVTPGGFVVTPLINQCSALVRTAADANALIVVRETSDPVSTLSAGDFVDVEVLDWRRVFEQDPDTAVQQF